MTKLFENMMTGLDEVDAFLAGETIGCKVSVPAEVDVKEIRRKLKMTQSHFSDTFGFSLDAVKHWEGGRRTPESSARAFLTVISRNPNAVISALHPQLQRRTGRAKHEREGRTSNEEYYGERTHDGDYAVKTGNAERARAVVRTQAKALEGAKDLNPGNKPHIKRVRTTATGRPGPIRKTQRDDVSESIR